MAAYWICAAFTVISAVVSLTYSSLAARTTDHSTAKPEARYALVRSAALLVVTAGALVGEHHDWLVAAATAMTIVQAGDALVGFGSRDRLKTIGPGLTALVNLGLLIWYLAA